ncbi:hypothetical protein SNEBB_006300 [Seison nebaliae]|nr:hypothetical protein SNEBB_006300 [Seison nebaliae]
MGVEHSLPESSCNHFDSEEISKIIDKFKKIDKDRSGTLSTEEFHSIPSLNENPLLQRVIDTFDLDKDGEIDFKEFIEGVSVFSMKNDKIEKLKFAFKIYDIDNDGYIGNGELFQVLKTMVGNNLEEEQLQQIVDKTIWYADTDKDGKISFNEFKSIVDDSLQDDLHESMKINIIK